MTIGASLSLFLLVPLLSSAVAAVVPSLLVRRFLMLAVPFAGVIGSAYLLYYLTIGAGREPGVVADNVGGFVGGISIPLVADSLAAMMILATSVVALTASWFADIVGESTTRFFPSLAILLQAGAWGALLTADLFNLFVFIEVMLMPSFGLLAMTGTWARLSAARMFIVVNLVTSLILLAGVATTYGVIGTTNIAALAGAAGPRGTEFAEGVGGNQWQLIVALGMVLIALSIKAGMAPVHTWLPRAYPSTSAAVMALFSGIHTKIGVYAIFRVFLTIFEGDPVYAWGVVGLMVMGMMIGAYTGLSESTVRGALAYQMVNGIPFILIALAFLQDDAILMLSAALFYMLHHMVVASSLIMASGAIEETYRTGRIRPLSGLLRRDPFVAIVFAMGSLAIIGFPPFSGVMGKLGLVMGMATDGSWLSWVAIGAVIVAGFGTLLTMVYVWREVFLGRDMNDNECDPKLRIRPRFVLPSATMIGLSVVMFLLAGPMYAITESAAKNLTDTTEYVDSVLGETDNTIGRVLDAGPSGLEHVPDGAVNSIQEEARNEDAQRSHEDPQPAPEEKH